MALLLHQFPSIPLARTLSSRSLAIPSSSYPRSLSVASHVAEKKLLGMSEGELQQLAVDLGQERYRGKQLHQLLYKRKAKDIDDFTYMPQSFRKELQEAGWSVGRSPVHRTVTAADGTIKLLLKLEDSRLVETVGIPVEDEKGSVRLTACVSSQVGCPLRCSFCATGKGGYSRNLQRHEIVEQVLAIEDLFKHRVTNVVFMGMGEPMLNMKSVLEAHRCLNQDIKIGQRMITISTVGVPNTIKKLASHKLQSTLAFACSQPETSRNYTGVNDSVEHAIELAELLHGWGRGQHVNLIPFNPIEGSEYRRPYKKAMLAFAAALESRKITASIRQTRGLDASAACGQLRNEFQKKPLLLDLESQQSEELVSDEIDPRKRTTSLCR
ncbi:putative dual-specificity RNA methyltransferase RlmN [Drosera capensis]